MRSRIDEADELNDAERTLVAALRDDYVDACQHAPIPSAGLVWWRATLRARAEAAEKVERPLTIAHGVIGAAVAGAACAAAAAVWQLVPALPHPSPVVLAGIAAAVCVVVAPFALVWTLARDERRP